MDLDQLFDHHGTDKARNGYAPVYHAILKNIRQLPLQILEVGIGTMLPNVRSSMVGWSLPGYRPGGSLRAWRDYLPRAQIYGCDVQPDTQFSDERIETFLCDSTDSAAVTAAFAGRPELRFDVLIDDGSHLDEHQLATLRNLYARVKPGGYYVVEDIYPGSRLLTEFRDQVNAIVHGDLTFVTAEKNLMIVSRRSA